MTSIHCYRHFAKAMLWLLPLASVLPAAEPPNVILILADDLAIGDLSCFNAGRSRTPRLDALLANSVYFENAYAGSPVCAPSRAALLTGRYPHRTGSVTLNQLKFPELTRLHLDETTLADRFSANGYATGLVGKWHSGPGAEYHPLRRGFDEYVGFNDSTDIKTYFKFQLDVQGSYQRFEGPYLTEELTRRALDFIQRHQHQPFFLHLAHYAPHRPLSAPAEIIARYTATGLPDQTAKVYAMIEVMDREIGRVIDELERLQLSQKTLIIFASDNGPDPLVGERFNLTNRGTKYMVNEGGIHVPLMFCWSEQLLPGSRQDVVHFTDIVPTLIQICRLSAGPAGKPLDGRSFASLLCNQWPREAALPSLRFWQWNRKVPLYSHNAAVREGDWKLVRPFVTRNIPEGESNAAAKLYHLKSDPDESNDLSAYYPERKNNLLKKLRQWAAEVEAERVQDHATSSK